ncbi:MAG TPA: tetratricopeptide repeat protein [Gemmataceae bacterium]|nr:tetratricopeptide repeat protein [Gemmataceae bacterium]
MGAALLVEYYQRMPTRRAKDDAETWRKRQEEGRQKFLNLARARYTEGTLLRLLENQDLRARRAALAALCKIGTMEASEATAARLQDEDAEVRQLAADALWGLWFRGDTEENNQELQRLVRVRDRDKALTGLDQLIGRAPQFAEAYNQRAVLFFRLKQYDRSIADCEKAVQLNPHHFGALAGMAQCYVQLRKPKAALKAFRCALNINPNLDGVAETIRALETTLGEEGRKDDKK